MKRKSFYLAVFLVLLSRMVYAGGISLRDAQVNGHPIDERNSVEVQPNTAATLCAHMEAYIFGKPHDSAYAVFHLRELTRLSPRGAYLIFARPVEQDYGVQYCVEFQTPDKPGIFAISYSHIPMFRSDFKDFTETRVGYFSSRHLSHYPRSNDVLGQIRVVSIGEATPEVATYLKLNGQTPGVNAHVDGGIDKDPIVFSWFVRPNIPNVEYRYRLYPDESEWSDWTIETKATEYFIPVGAHQFQVATRVKVPSGGSIETREAEYGFILEKPFIAKPIKKASLTTNVKSSIPIDINKVYSRSRALLIGVTRYDDKQFGPLPYTAQDVKGVDAALRNVGFTDITSRLGPLTKTQMTAAIEQFSRSAALNERLVIYISTHGFEDPQNKGKGYIVTTDCKAGQPASTCLGLSELDSLLEPAIYKPVRHLLVLLDTCSSGLGVIAKSGEFYELPIAAKPGTHMMTAGLADQNALEDPALQMSTFTYYLIEGLNGGADYTQQKFISLSELLVYVRYMVARRTNGTQTPMLGRLNGSGEMIFRVPSKAGQ